MIDYIHAEPFDGHQIRYHIEDGTTYFLVDDIYCILEPGSSPSPDSLVDISLECLQQVLTHSAIYNSSRLLEHIENAVMGA